MRRLLGENPDLPICHPYTPIESPGVYSVPLKTKEIEDLQFFDASFKSQGNDNSYSSILKHTYSFILRSVLR
jgi:hypothetical protein